MNSNCWQNLLIWIEEQTRTSAEFNMESLIRENLYFLIRKSLTKHHYIIDSAIRVGVLGYTTFNLAEKI